MKPWLADLLGGWISTLIVLVGMIAWSFVLTGGWPPQYLLIAASIGGALSPSLWMLIRWIRGESPESN